MATFGQDAFTGTTGTLLSAHTPDVGGSWAIAAGTTNTAQLTSAGRLRGTGIGAEADYINQGTPASADYDVGADLWSGTTQGNYAGVLGRADASAGTNVTTGVTYIGQYDQSVLQWSIWKGVNGGFAIIGTAFGATLTNSTTTTFLMGMRGTVLTLTVAGTQRVSTTDSAVTATGKAGAFVNGASTVDATSYELDNFVASDPVAASSFPPVPRVWHNPLLPM